MIADSDKSKISPSFDENRTTLGKVLPLETPYNVIIDVSEVCNFKCEYCFRSDKNQSAWGYARNQRLMKWDIFTRIVDQIKEFPQMVKQVSLSNHGEPLCNRKLPDMVRYIKDHGIKSRISIHTNASLLEGEYSKLLAESSIDKMVISLQGLSTEKYVSICGYDISFEKLYNNIKEFYHMKKNTQVFIKIMDVALDANEEDLFYELFLPIADRVYIEKMVPIWSGMNYKGECIEEQIIRNKYGEEFPAQRCCPLLFHTIVIEPEGNVYPCTQLLQTEILGNVKDKTLLTMWNGKERSKMLRNQCSLHPMEACGDCNILQNTIFTEEDMIDMYRKDILKRLEGSAGDAGDGDVK